MGQVVLFAPGQYICDYAEKLRANLPDKNNMQIIEAHMDEAVDWAKGFEHNDVDVLIARGDTAKMLRQSRLPYPVIDIRIPDEAFVGSILEAGAITDTDNPVIGIVGVETFVEKIQSFFKIFQPQIIIYTAKSKDHIRTMVTRAKQEGVDVVIGGELTCRYAKQLQMKYVMIDTTYELVKEAYEQALEVQRAMEAEKQRAEEFKMVLNSVTDALINIDEYGKVVTMNNYAVSVLGYVGRRYEGLSAEEILGEKHAEMINGIIIEGKRSSGIPVLLGGENYAMTVSPILVNSQSKGAIVTLINVPNLQKLETKIRKGLYVKGNVAGYTFDNIMGASESLQSSLAQARSFAPLQSNILIIGQTGTGKELFAQGIHNSSERSSGPFVAVNCGAIPTDLIESELFGYVDGAFTGAKKGGKAGYFELAHHGTIFLDEISEMDLRGQVRLLRVIQEKEIRRVGADAVIPIDVRIIAACNTNLKHMVERGEFRKDLYYRLSVLVIHLPALKQRQSDIKLLASHFIREFNQKFQKQVSLSPEAVEALQTLEWEGNIRQLRNFCERLAAVSSDNMVISARTVFEDYKSSYVYEDLDESVTSVKADTDTDTSTRKVSQTEIERLLRKYKGNKSKVAAELNISRTTLWKYLKEND